MKNKTKILLNKQCLKTAIVNELRLCTLCNEWKS